MRALTLWQPWAHAILHLGKGVENRSWRPPYSMLGERFAIHAAKRKADLDAVAKLRDAGFRVPDDLPSSAIVGTVKLVAFVERETSGRPFSHPYRIVEHVASTHRVHELLERHFGAWYDGGTGWVVDEPIPLGVPAGCAGMQGLWTVPPDLAALVDAESRR